MDTSIKRILIPGGTGFLGQALKKYFEANNCEVRVLTRTPSKKDASEIYWDAKLIGDWISEIEWADAVINLTGKSVNCRYNQKNKDLILSSRIESTAVLCKAMAQAENPPKIWINSSSASTYVHSEEKQMTEDEGIIGDDFSMNVCKQWEAEFFKCNLNYTRRVAIRTSIVLAKNGGAFPIMKRLAKFLMGGKQGNGKQFISWIHISDFCKALEFILDHPELVGPVNVTNPTPVRNAEFMKSLRQRYKIPFGISQSRAILEFGAKLIGTETEMVMKSRNVIPERLLEAGFEFEYDDIDKCFKTF